MTSRRGSTVLWTTASSESALGPSKAANVPSPNVAVLIQNLTAGAKTFKVQASAGTGRSAGQNESDGGDGANLVWYDVQKADGSGDVVLTTATSEGNVAYDLSPFAPEMIRLVSIEGFTQGTIVASVVSS